MVEEEMNEFAIIFKRKQKEIGYELVEEFIPYKVVEGYYYEQDDYFIDSEGNSYSHMASMDEIGNVYACRRNIAETISCDFNANRTISQIKNNILAFANTREYYKATDESTQEYGIIKMKNKETGKISRFEDKDTKMYYEMYEKIQNAPEDIKKENTKTKQKSQTEKEKNKEKEEEKEYETPLELIDEIKKTIKGQDEAVEAIVTLLWMKYHYPDIPKANIMLIGPSGVGKTAIFKKIKELLDIPMVIYGIPGTSQAGYRGHDIDEMFLSLYYESEEDVAKAQNAIVFIDEFDKLASSEDGREVGTVAVQYELLKPIEGCEQIINLDNHNTFSINTSNIIFVCCGAFSELFEKTEEKVIGFNNYPKPKNPNEKITTEDIIKKGGIIKELVGRLPVIIELNDLNDKPEVLKDILLNSNESLFATIINVLNKEGIEIENIDEVIDLIIENAASKRIGARGLIGPVRNMFLRIFYEISNNKGKYEKVIIGKNIVNDNHDFILVPKKVKKKVKTDSLMVI